MLQHDFFYAYIYNDQAGEIREVTLWVDPERRHKLGRRATLCEAFFGITPGVFLDKIRVMVAGFIPDGEAMKNKNIKIGDWLRSINSNNVTFQNLDQILSEIITPSNVRIITITLLECKFVNMNFYICLKSP